MRFFTGIRNSSFVLKPFDSADKPRNDGGVDSVMLDYVIPWLDPPSHKAMAGQATESTTCYLYLIRDVMRNDSLAP
ncbi:hypothetical protein ACFL6W_09390 [Thermodesulfobacteriota bacterium]